jgi:hypothetical protein
VTCLRLAVRVMSIQSGGMTRARSQRGREAVRGPKTLAGIAVMHEKEKALSTTGAGGVPPPRCVWAGVMLSGLRLQAGRLRQQERRPLPVQWHVVRAHRQSPQESDVRWRQ